MSANTDPFDRAVSREQSLRKRGEVFTSETANVKMIIRWFAMLMAAWGLVLVGHWLLLSDPHWLVVAHTVVFAVYVVLCSCAAVFTFRMTRRREQVLGEG